jgi:septal ring factor EnvC (AmiA/AmiB activator)
MDDHDILTQMKADQDNLIERFNYLIRVNEKINEYIGLQNDRLIMLEKDFAVLDSTTSQITKEISEIYSFIKNEDAETREEAKRSNNETREEARRSIVTWSVIAGLIGGAAGVVITALVFIYV